jgi:hypothetical protein
MAPAQIAPGLFPNIKNRAKQKRPVAAFDQAATGRRTSA